MKGKIFILILGIFLISSIMAGNICDESCDSCLGAFKQGEPITLKQTCSNCTYVNLSSITYPSPDAKIVSLNKVMNKVGVDFNFTYTDTFRLGNYIYTVFGDKDGTIHTEDICYIITPSGNSGNAVFYILIIIIVYGLSLIGFFGENEILTLLGSIPMFLLGIFIIADGLIIYRESITYAIGLVSIAVGAYFSFEAGRGLWGNM